jgi:hypothetical protein
MRDTKLRRFGFIEYDLGMTEPNAFHSVGFTCLGRGQDFGPIDNQIELEIGKVCNRELVIRQRNGLHRFSRIEVAQAAIAFQLAVRTM